jgi:hypothetical protein
MAGRLSDVYVVNTATMPPQKLPAPSSLEATPKTPRRVEPDVPREGRDALAQEVAALRAMLGPASPKEPSDGTTDAPGSAD